MILLWEIKTLPQAGGTALQDIRHTWDAGGNLSTRQNVLASETETFGYDFLDRLTLVSGPYTESYTYDTLGNMTSMNGTSYTYGENGAGPHEATTVGEAGYIYDDNGNMISREDESGTPSSGQQVTVSITATPVQAPAAGNTVLITAAPVLLTNCTEYTWDVENRLVAVTGGTSFVYDGDGSRVKKTESGETILYVNKYYEKNLTTGIVTTNYYLGGRLIAERQGTTLQYVHQDALTGTSLTTNSSGTSTGSIKYFSFGQTRSGSVPTEQKFTGQRLDSTGLYYYGARYYDPQIGRFISADTIVSSPANPQSLNRYSYCLNNPLKYVDPSGHDQVITSTGTSVNGQEGYFICDGAGNLLAVAYGFDDLAAKSKAVESQSRGVDLPVAKQTVDTSPPQPADPSNINEASSVIGATIGTGEVIGLTDIFIGIGTTAIKFCGVAGMIFGLLFIQGDAPNVNMAIKAPGIPTEKDGYIPPKNWNGQKVKAPDGRYGYPDKNGNVWVPSGTPEQGGHGGPHWDVEHPGGGYGNYDNVFPK